MSPLPIPRLLVCVVLALVNLATPGWGQVEGLSDLHPNVLTADEQRQAQAMLEEFIERRTREFNVSHREAWKLIQTRAQWEAYRDERIARLRASLGDLPQPGAPRLHVTGEVVGDGYRIQNIAYESRPGIWVTGNLYQPREPLASMPGMLIAHAHHNAKYDGELQDMGMTWGRAGCYVLVIDQVGYAERRAHPFQTDADYPHPYRPSRQDYFFRYDSGIQLQLMGDSLMGWMVGDLMRGVDVLLSRPGIDAKRILLLGGVAGGGDPAGVTAALDPRIACVVPFNFGGPQPESRYPLPDDAEETFNFLLFTYWDSTRGLRLGARDDFPHWVITASIAPRALIHAHEFSWDGERDPVWKRYQKIWGSFYDAGDRIGVAHGKGLLRGQPPEASHCNHIGAFHRQMIHPLFERWFNIRATEFSDRRPRSDLVCLTDKARSELAIRKFTEVLPELATDRIRGARRRLAGKSASERRDLLRSEWSQRLGPVAPPGKTIVVQQSPPTKMAGAIDLNRLVLATDLGSHVPMLVLRPQKGVPIRGGVIAVATQGKAGFLKHRAAELKQLVQAGIVVVLPDLRGLGETQRSPSRGRDSYDTDHSVHLQVFGETLLGERIRDLRSVLAYLQAQPDLKAAPMMLWGDSFAELNPADANLDVPHGVEGRPKPADPTGALLVQFTALFEDDLRGVYAAGGLVGFVPILTHHSVYVPHGDLVPGAVMTGDLGDIWSALEPLPVRTEAPISPLNLPLSEADWDSALSELPKTPATWSRSVSRTSAAEWLLRQVPAQR